jgi:MoxR-like ATPase
MTKQNYKIVCPPLNVVLIIKKYDLREERRLWEKLRRKIEDAEEPIHIQGYMEAILKSFLVDADNFFESLDEDERTSVVSAAYTAVVSLYPIFQLEFICNELNSSLFSEHFRNFFLERLKNDPDSPLLVSLMGEDPLNIPILDKDKLDSLSKFLSKNLIGQNEAINAVVDSLKVMAAGLSSFSSLFFIGPTGVGKTQLARLLGKHFGGNFYKVNCGEFSQGHEYAKLIGSPPGYVGHSDKSILAEKAEESSRWVFLFDEIEKAHHKFYDFLLSLLDEGTVTDNMGKTLDFSDSVFIFTSNQGTGNLKLGEPLGFSNEKITYDHSREEIQESVKKHFPPEFLNRIDEYITFNQLSPKDIREIVKLELRGVPIKKTKSLLDYVVKGGYSEEYGARNIKRFIKSNVSVKVAEAMLEKEVPKKAGSMYSPKIIDQQLHIVDTIPYEEKKDAPKQRDSSQTSGT